MAKRRTQAARLAAKKNLSPPLPDSVSASPLAAQAQAAEAADTMPAGYSMPAAGSQAGYLPGAAEYQPDYPESASLDFDEGPQVATRQAAAWLTVETLLWGAVLLLAAGLRLLELGRFALNGDEANLSLSALNWFRGSAMGATDVSPAAAGLTAFIFTVFGSGDVTARVLEAMAGVIPVLLTYRLRDALGRWQALAAALLLALSASFLHASRIANGEIVAIAGMYTALSCLWTFVRARHTRDLYVAAAGLGVALAAGQTAYTVLLICGSFALITAVLRATHTLDVPELDALIEAIRAAPQAARNAVITFVVSFLAVTTAGLTNSLGLQGAVNIASGWLTQWTLTPNQPPSYYIELLGTYEMLPLVFGLAGLFVYLGRGDRSSLFLAWWIALALTFYTLSPNKQPEAMLVMLVPLVWASGRAIGDLLDSLRRDFSLQNDGVFVLLGALTCGIFGINLSSYASDGQPNHLIVVSIALGMLIVLGLLAGGFAVMYRSTASGTMGGTAALSGPGPAQWLNGLSRGVAVLGSIGLLGLGSLFVSQSMNLNFNHADDPHEPLVDAPSTMEAQGLGPMLSELSNRWEGDPFSAPIAADANVGSVLRWYLRDFRNVRYFDSSPATAPEPIVIVAAQGPQPGFANYAGQKVRWRWLELAQPASGLSYLRWLLYRGLHDVPASYDIIVYVQMR